MGSSLCSLQNKEMPNIKRKFVLGLPTGSSPLGMYKTIELNKSGYVSFQHVVTFTWMKHAGLPGDSTTKLSSLHALKFL